MEKERTWYFDQEGVVGAERGCWNGTRRPVAVSVGGGDHLVLAWVARVVGMEGGWRVSRWTRRKGGTRVLIRDLSKHASLVVSLDPGSDGKGLHTLQRTKCREVQRLITSSSYIRLTGILHQSFISASIKARAPPICLYTPSHPSPAPSSIIKILSINPRHTSPAK